MEKLKQMKTMRRLGLLAGAVLLMTCAHCMVGCSGGSDAKPLGVAESMDSLCNYLKEGTVIVARFPDEERHGLYYLNSGVLYFFDGKNKNLEEIAISGVESGNIKTARLTPDEKYISISVLDGMQMRLFRLNTANRNVVDLEKSEKVELVDTTTVKKEEKKERKVQAAPKKEEKTEEVTVETEYKEPAREGVLEGVMVEQQPTE